jgi:hypothetical protein
VENSHYEKQWYGVAIGYCKVVLASVFEIVYYSIMVANIDVNIPHPVQYDLIQWV